MCTEWDLTHLTYGTTSLWKICRQMSNESLLSAHGNAIWRAWIGISQDIDLNSRHVGSNLFRTNRRWWVSICSTTPGKVCAIKLPRQLQICSRSPLRAVLCHACEVPGHTTAIIIASLQRLCRIISRSALGGAIRCDPWATSLSQV